MDAGTGRSGTGRKFKGRWDDSVPEHPELFQRNPSRNLKIDLCDTLRSDIMSKMLRNIPRHINKLLAQTEGKLCI